jgi:CHRD domain
MIMNYTIQSTWKPTLLGIAFALAPLSANAASITFSSVLNGAQEVPPVNTTAMGSATGNLSGSAGSYVFSYNIDYSKLQGVIDAPFVHIHNAPFGANGPIVHDVDNASQPPIAGSSQGQILGDWRFDDPLKPLTDALAQELLNGNLYFNIHTTFAKSGELRGQILKSAQSTPEPVSLLGVALAGGAGVLLRWNRSMKASQ